MLFACRTTKTTNTQSEYATCIPFARYNGYANAPQYYVYKCIAVLVNFSQEHAEVISYCKGGRSRLFWDFGNELSEYTVSYSRMES